MARGRLRVYLGAAPGVGKTYAMLGEGHRRAGRGTDVVVGFVETHGRPVTEAMIGGLEQVPRAELTYRDATFTEMDLDAVLERHPEIALVDELAHTNVPGSRNAKRWEDVEELLAAGIGVISTVNVQHLESLNDVVESITGVPQRETVPDEIVRRADQIELVDMSPEALRRRMAHGNVYAPEKVDAALSHYFRVGNLTALRELALLWVADRVDTALAAYRAEQGIAESWPARERVVVALTGGPEGEALIRGGARIASRGAAGELMAVYVSRSDGLTGASPGALAQQRTLVESLGGTFHSVVGEDTAKAILDFARGVNASQIVLGSSRRSRLASLTGPGVGTEVVRGSGDIDVHMVTHDYVGRGRVALPRGVAALGRRRTTAGWVAAMAGPLALAGLLSLTRDLHTLPIELMLFLALTVGVALIGGLWPALAAAVIAGVVVNYFFVAPLYTLTIDEPQNVFALLVFLVVAGSVASVVDRAARRTAQAARARAESETLSLLAGSVLRGEQALPALLDRVRETFAMSSVALLQRADDRSPWRCVDSVGDHPCGTPEEADAEVPVSDTLALALRGRTLPAEDRRLLDAFAAQAAVVLEQRRLTQEAREARRLAASNQVRTALLAAVSHDLRTPLSSIKASVSSLRQQDVTWDEEDRAELLATIEESADRLDALVGNLLDMSRLQTGTVVPHLAPVALDAAVAGALVGLARADEVEADVPEDLPAVLADAGLLERVIANIVENALKHTVSPGRPAGWSAGRDGLTVRVTGSALGRRIELRVVDRGPGVREEDKARIFEPFQRLGDAPGRSGVGLGLAVARGFTEAMNGQLEAEDTPGGGLTMVLTLPPADDANAGDAGALGPAAADRTGAGDRAGMRRTDPWVEPVPQVPA